MYKKGSIRRTERGDEQYFNGFCWQPFPKNTYDGHTRSKQQFPFRVKIHWETQTFFAIIRIENYEILFLKKKFSQVFLRQHLFLFRLGKDHYICIGATMFLLVIELPIQRVVSQFDYSERHCVAIYTEKHVYFYDRNWKKVTRKPLDEIMQSMDINDPFFIKEELPYLLQFCPFSFQKIDPCINWSFRLKASVHLFKRSTSISGSILRPDSTFLIKYFEFSHHLPEYIRIKIKNVNPDLRYRYFILLKNQEFIGYLVLFETLMNGNIHFQTKKIFPLQLWKKEWLDLIFLFLNTYFRNPSWKKRLKIEDLDG
jgi:hypothetical protein